MSNHSYTHASARLNLYFNTIPNDMYLQDDIAKISIKSIAETYDIPISVVRNDLATITASYKKYFSYIPFIPSNESHEDKNVEDLVAEIKSGLWDSYDLICAINLTKGVHTIPLSPEEFTAIQEEFSTIGKPNYSGNPTVPCIVKENFKHHTNRKELIQILTEINQAINAKKQIAFKYTNAKKNNSTIITTAPIKILYDNEENTYSILGIKNKSYSVHKVDSIEKSKVMELPLDVANSDLPANYEAFIHILLDDSEPYDAAALEEKLPHVWKNDFSTKKATHVKVKFKAEVFERVYSDLSLRHPQKLLSHIKNGFFYFEDDIFGIDAFDMWIRTYGDNAVIIAPEKLALRRIQSIKEALENYK